jgi:ribonuclease HII
MGALNGMWWSKDITKNRKKMIYKSMVKSVLIYGAESWSLCEDDKRRINATEMDALRRSARISKLNRKTNEYIREKMDAPDTVLDEITRKQLIWYGHVERMDPTRLPKIMINWKPEGRKKTRPCPKDLE